MNIHYITPYSVDKNIGKAYNEACALVPDGDWICLRDGDTMFLTPDWGQRIEQIVKRANFLHYSLIGCMTNRLGTGSKQIIPGYYDEHNIRIHHAIAKLTWGIHRDAIQPFNNVLAGHFLLFPKSTWNKHKFEENTAYFDSAFSNDIVREGGKLGLATGMYIYHMYRIWSEFRQPEYDTEHLMK